MAKIEKKKSSAAPTEYEESSSGPEDEDGELITPKVENSILKTLLAVKSKDPMIYDPQFSFFNSNGEEQSGKRKRKKRKKELTPKEAFLQAIDGMDESSDNVLELKVKTEEEKKADDMLYREFMNNRSVDDSETTTESLQLLRRFFGAEDEMTDGDKFLRDYILFEGWKKELPRRQHQPTAAEAAPSEAGPSEAAPSEAAEASEEEEAHLKAVDDHERRWNFRFEEPGGTEIQTNLRLKVEDSERIKKPGKRKRKRERQNERKREKMAEEIQSLLSKRKAQGLPFVFRDL